jgi:hypothetical protein
VRLEMAQRRKPLFFKFSFLPRLMGAGEGKRAGKVVLVVAVVSEIPVFYQSKYLQQENSRTFYSYT